jgi:hypothetical protein
MRALTGSEHVDRPSTVKSLSDSDSHCVSSSFSVLFWKKSCADGVSDRSEEGELEAISDSTV